MPQDTRDALRSHISAMRFGARDVCRITGLSHPTLQNWRRRGLFGPPDSSQVRRYSPYEIELVTICQSLSLIGVPPREAYRMGVAVLASVPRGPTLATLDGLVALVSPGPDGYEVVYVRETEGAPAIGDDTEDEGPCRIVIAFPIGRMLQALIARLHPYVDRELAHAGAFSSHLFDLDADALPRA